MSTGFVFDPRLYNLQLLVLERFDFVLFFFFLWRTDTIVFSELNKPPSPLSTPPPPSNGLEIIKPPGGLNRGFTVELSQSQRLHARGQGTKKNGNKTITAKKKKKKEQEDEE